MNNAKKSVWMRLGVKIELTEEELRLVQESNDGTVIMVTATSPRKKAMMTVGRFRKR
jgi:hypothetical protein